MVFFQSVLQNAFVTDDEWILSSLGSSAELPKNKVKEEGK
jgi:hypothetical protein